MNRHRSLAIAALLALASAAPLTAQVLDWQNQWYWGAKGGLLSYSLPSGRSNQVQVGGEWLITARRTALYVAYSSTLKKDGDTFTSSTGATIPAVFDGFQRIQLAVLVFPWNGNVQPYAGGGLVIESLSNAVVNSATPTAVQSQFISDHSSGGFAMAMAGLQIRVARLAVFGQLQFSPQGRDFLLPNSSISFEAGVRYAFLGSRETGEIAGQK
jgi:hypothetical protein